jgi:hypothetical protein
METGDRVKYNKGKNKNRDRYNKGKNKNRDLRG